MFPFRNLEQPRHDVFRIHMNTVVRHLIRDILLGIFDLRGCVLRKRKVDVPGDVQSSIPGMSTADA